MPKHYPDLPLWHLNHHTDWFIDELFDHPQAARFVFPYSRFYADMKRIVKDPLESKGMGIFYTHTPWGVPYRLQDEKELKQVRQLYHQWHDELKQAAEHKIQQTGYCLLVDCHSYSPHTAEDGDNLPDIKIGTNALTSSPDLTQLVLWFWQNKGYTVSINKSYACCIEPTHKQGMQTIMIEINKRCYLNENFGKTAQFERVKADCHDMLKQLDGYVPARFMRTKAG
jgi:N-formylglutamate amidohydrolase